MHVHSGAPPCCGGFGLVRFFEERREFAFESYFQKVAEKRLDVFFALVGGVGEVGMQVDGVAAGSVAGLNGDVAEFLAAHVVLHAEVAHREVGVAVRHGSGEAGGYEALAAAVDAHCLQVGVAYAAAEVKALRGDVARTLQCSVQRRVAADDAAVPEMAIIVGHCLHTGVGIAEEAQTVHQQRIHACTEVLALGTEPDAGFGSAFADLRVAYEFADIEVSGVHGALHLDGAFLVSEAFDGCLERGAPYAGTETAAGLQAVKRALRPAAEGEYAAGGYVLDVCLDANFFQELLEAPGGEGEVVNLCIQQETCASGGAGEGAG